MGSPQAEARDGRGTPAISGQFKPIPRLLARVGDAEHARARRPRGKIVIGAFSLALIGAAVGLALGPDSLRAPAALLIKADRWIAAQGFGIDQISLEGHRYTTDADIFDALELPDAGSMLRFNGTEAAARILQLPWVQRVQIKPLVPNGLHIVVTERTPFAVWEQVGPAGSATKHQLIDETGRFLMVVGAQAFAGLPRIRGDGASTAAADLHATLSLFPAIATRLQVAERIGARRWILVLDRGLRIHLPVEQEAAALQNLAVLQVRHGLLDRDLAEIDLREPGLTVRPRLPAAVAGSVSTTPNL